MSHTGTRGSIAQSLMWMAPMTMKVMPKIGTMMEAAMITGNEMREARQLPDGGEEGEGGGSREEVSGKG